MKYRLTLVSNSSSTSFIMRGMKVDLRDFCKLIDFKDSLSEEDILNFNTNDLCKYIEKTFESKIEVVPVRNWFDMNKPFTDIIIGLRSHKQLEDGEIVQLDPIDPIDEKVKKEIEKLGYNPQLATFVQYVSNDNC